MNKSPNFRVIVAEPVVMQPRLHIMPLPLEPDALVGQFSPDIRLVGCVALCGLLRLLCFSPPANIAGVVCHPLGQMVGPARLGVCVPELIGRCVASRIR